MQGNTILRSRGYIDDIVLRHANNPESYFKLCHNNYVKESRFDNLINEIDRKIKENINLTHEERRLIMHSLKFKLAGWPGIVSVVIDLYLSAAISQFMIGLCET